jgi:hypothetical protein
MKKTALFAMAAMTFSSMALAGDEPDWLPTNVGGTEPTVSAYLDSEPKPGKSNVFRVKGEAFKVVGCPAKRFAGGTVYTYTRCPEGDKMKKWMKEVWCADNKGKQWWYRVGTNDLALPNTCPKK